MDLDLSDDQVALRDGIVAMLTARVPTERVRAGFDRALFAELAEAGVFSLRADGFAWADCAVVFEQLGRSCVPGPLVPSLLDGNGRIAGVLAGGWVEHFDALDVVVVPELGTCTLDTLDAEPSPWPLDPATPVARVDAIPDALAPVEFDWTEWRQAGAVLTAALQVGLADRLTEATVAYAKERMQFGRPIGSFQAVKHRCADMLVEVEHARSAAYHAAWAHDTGVDDPSLAADLATVVCAAAYLAVAKSAVQVHGGIGFTWEHPAHLYYKRAVSDAALLGGRAAAADRLAAAVLDRPLDQPLGRA
jgi:alkylation response protein AidB-like acyl-CoA dehydrogenase